MVRHQPSLEAELRFTGKERDAETSLDYFGARYYSGAQGRFTSPDEFTGGAVDPSTGQQVGQPGPLPYADITNPQSLNKYAYVLNNPLRYTDPDGHCVGALGLFCPEIIAAGEWLAAGGDKILTGAFVLGGTALAALTSNMSGDQLGTPDTFGGGNPNVFHMSDANSGGNGQQAKGQQSTPAAPDPGPYKRPKNATTPEQRAAVQGQPCATCGATGQKNVADHKEPLVVEHYRTGTIDQQRMRSPGAVQPQCQNCSNQQGGFMASLSKAMKKLFFGSSDANQ